MQWSHLRGTLASSNIQYAFARADSRCSSFPITLEELFRALETKNLPENGEFIIINIRLNDETGYRVNSGAEEDEFDR